MKKTKKWKADIVRSSLSREELLYPSMKTLDVRETAKEYIAKLKKQNMPKQLYIEMLKTYLAHVEKHCDFLFVEINGMGDERGYSEGIKDRFFQSWNEEKAYMRYEIKESESPFEHQIPVNKEVLVKKSSTSKKVVRKNPFIMHKEKFIELLLRLSLDDVGIVDKESERYAGRIYGNYERYERKDFTIPESPRDRINFPQSCTWGAYRCVYDIGKEWGVINDYGRGYTGLFPDFFLFHDEKREQDQVRNGCRNSRASKKVIEKVTQVMSEIGGKPIK